MARRLFSEHFRITPRGWSSGEPQRQPLSAGSTRSMWWKNQPACGPADPGMGPSRLWHWRTDLRLRGFLCGARLLMRSPAELLQVPSVLLTALLAACSTSGSQSRDAPRKELLETLRQCFVQVSLHNGKEGYQSPCAREDVSRLNGITRGELIDALGPPQFCTSPTEGGFPKGDDCAADQNPQWSFYHLPQSVYTGGGPDLVCESDSRRRCVHVVWRTPR
jgi:hypothetical protein